MNLQKLILLLVVLNLSSCDWMYDEKVEDVSLEIDKSEAPSVPKPIVLDIENKWKNYYLKNNEPLNFDNFVEQEPFVLNKEKSTLKPIWSDSFEPINKNFLRYNSDSTQYIDFMSYKIDLDEKGDILFSPDQEIVLVNIPEHTVERILYFGPSFWIEEAYFKNDSTVVLFENSLENIPAYYEIDLNTLQSKYYVYKDPIDFESKYLEENTKIFSDKEL